MKNRIRGNSIITIGLALLVSALTSVLVGAGCGLNTKCLSIQVEGLPEGLEDCKIAHLSDLHIKKERDFPFAIINQLEEIEPDLIFITGDFVEEADKIEICVKYVGQLKARYGAWAVPGNWDHWMGNPEELTHQLRRAGGNVLINAHTKITIRRSIALRFA